MEIREGRKNRRNVMWWGGRVESSVSEAAANQNRRSAEKHCGFCRSFPLSPLDSRRLQFFVWTWFFPLGGSPVCSATVIRDWWRKICCWRQLVSLEKDSNFCPNKVMIWCLVFLLLILCELPGNVKNEGMEGNLQIFAAHHYRTCSSGR
jgi:hypothetical protein